MWSTSELIVAPATAPGPGGRAVVRLSGEGLGTLLDTLFRSAAGFGVDGKGMPRRIRATLGAPGLADEWGAVGVEILHWPGPQSPTGGPVAEVQLPASTLLADAVVGEACRHGARPARGGEFSLRAFLSGRLDLLQAEAVLAVVDASTPTELSAALDALAGGIGRRLLSLREALLDLAADVEATIDFADEATPDAVPVRDDAVRAAVNRRVAEAVGVIEDVAARLGGRDASAAEDLPRVVLAGPPNIGKSSLFNRLVGRDAALVADEPGTTRDWIAARLDAGADEPACLLVDSAGIADDEGPADDDLARASADRAQSEIARAAVLVACRDAQAEREAIPRTAAASCPTPRIDVLTRCDLDDARAQPAGTILTSSHSGAGIQQLREVILARVGDLPSGRMSATARMQVGLSTARTALVAAAATWEDAVDASRPAADEAVVATLIRGAIAAIDEVTGAEIGTDLIERVFARHCIGK